MVTKKQLIDFRIRWSWHSLSRAYNCHAKKFNSSNSIGYALLNIDKNGTFSTELGPKMGMESRSLTRTLKNMLEQDLIVKNQYSNDKRKVKIFLTKKGIEFRKIASKYVKKFNETIFNNVPKEDLKSFYKVMDTIDRTINIINDDERL
jgi:DNA-binding MarR family transcriptional regulator